MLAVMLVGSACAVPLSVPGRTASEPAPLERPYPAISDRLLVEVNRARQRVGAPPLESSDALDRVAQDYAAELVGRGVLDHTSPTAGRETMRQRIEAGGVHWRAAAENLGRRSGPAGDVASNIVAGWLSSPGHAANLLEPAYSRSGVGVVRDAAGRWYVVQLYVQPARP